MDTEKKRTVTLTGRPPVRITEADWPVIAIGSGDSHGGGDYSRRQQALAQGEVDRYAIRVRQHEDGRTIVYAVLDAAGAAWHAPAAGIDYRGGELLDADADGDPAQSLARIRSGRRVVEAIQRVGHAAGLPDAVIRECVADLPAEEI